MANKHVFSGGRGPLVPASDTINQAGGRAYKLAPRSAPPSLLGGRPVI